MLIPLGSAKAEGRAQVVDHQDNVTLRDGLGDKSIQVARMIHKTIRAARKLLGLTHIEELGGDVAGAGEAGDVGDHVAPEVGGSGVAVEEEDGLLELGRPGVDVGHGCVENNGEVAFEGALRGDLFRMWNRHFWVWL